MKARPSAEPTFALPGMTIATGGSRLEHGRDGPHLEISRIGANRWGVLLDEAAAGDEAAARREVLRAAIGRAGTSELSPSAVLRVADGEVRGAPQEAPAPSVAAVYASVELDTCGAWVTLSNAGPLRPVVVRKAGWVDVRGHPSDALGDDDGFDPADDRVGLGPGDALVLYTGAVVDATDATGASFADEALLDALLDVAGREPAEVTTSVIERWERWSAPTTASVPSIVVVGVPMDLGPDPLQRVAAATAIPAADLHLPGYPVGDLQPELWREPPRPPRLARLRLAPGSSSVRGVRRLLDRLLASWRLDGRIDDDDLKLLASELAANAIIHAGTVATVTIRYLGRVVRVEVDDASPDMPRPRTPDVDEPGGRGLQFVEAVASSWGVATSLLGKRVWCEVPVST